MSVQQWYEGIPADWLRVGDVIECRYDGKITVMAVETVEPDETFPNGSVRYSGRYSHKVEGKTDYTWHVHSDQNIEVLWPRPDLFPSIMFPPESLTAAEPTCWDCGAPNPTGRHVEVTFEMGSPRGIHTRRARLCEDCTADLPTMEDAL